MSFLAVVKTKIKDWDALLEACRIHEVDISEQEKGRHILMDRFGSGIAYLDEVEDYYRLTVDHDPAYCSLSNRLGRGMKQFTRTYAEKAAENVATQSGYSLMEREELPDGRLKLRVVNA